MARPEFHRLKVSGVRHLTSESVAISFNIPADLEKQFAFVPGQYLTLRADVNGEDLRRSYSICSKAGDPLEVGIKHLAGGRFSSFAQKLTVGSELDVMTPQGNFTAEPGGRHDYLLIAAGSGITPCLSIAKTILEQEPQSRITLIYGNRSTATMMFRQDIGDLKDVYTERLMVVNILSREKQEATWLNGRIGADTISQLITNGLIDPSQCDAAYVCGPLEMVDSVIQVLSGELEVRTELFTTDSKHVTSRPPPVVATTGEVQVSVTVDGSQYTIPVNPEAETVLAAAQKAGLDLPFSCAGGMCCTCRCKVVSGKTSMDLNFSLADWEVEAGFTLACQTRALDDSVVLDFDEF
ncbi:MAG: 2Fe-2S iron-sulfur cluster-binding protein [Pseudomonadota bacterium]